MSQSESLQDIIEGWRTDPNRHVLIIDETRTFLDKPHREFIVFVGIYASSGRLLEYCLDATHLRCELPEISRDEPIKGTDIWRLNETEEFRPFCLNLVSFFTGPYRCFIAATTQKNLEDSPAKVQFKIKDSLDGRPASVSGIELKLAAHFILRVGEVLGIKDRLEVFVDRSQKLGLSPRQRNISTQTGEIFSGHLREGSPLCIIVSVSDSGAAKDLLLLPDFAGNSMLKKSIRRLRGIQDIVTTGTPFWFEEVNLAAEMKSNIK